VSSPSLPEPIQFGKYTLFERIGRGGMAEVFKGRIQGPAGFERVFVVKRILPHLSDDATFIKMFVEEAKLSARLNHPNIVHIFELGAVEGEYFISMEYIRGHDLSETMRAIWKQLGPPHPELVAYIGREACRGLAYAHSLTDEAGKPLGMIHRDISPSNVMLSYEGAVKLLDFGIAKALGDTSEATKSGTMKGKYAYMAPEQTDGDNVDHRSDIFATGIVLHEVLTGRRLFKGNNDVQTIERVRACQVPPPSQQNPAVSPDLDAIVLKALARNPANRWQSAADMADALDDVVHAARFQPTHLAGQLHQLFPTEGSSAVSRKTMPPTASSPGTAISQVSQMSTATGRSIPSRTVPPVSRTATGANPMHFDGAGAPVEIKPKSKAGAWIGLLVVLGAAGAGWKMFGHKLLAPHPVAVTSDPSRRFYVHVKSTPDGADIYLGDGQRSMGATPVTLPIDLTGISSLKLTLKKPGYEDYQQLVTGDSQLSISLTPIGGPPPSPAGTGGAPPVGAEGEAKPKRHHRTPKPSADKPEDGTGEKAGEKPSEKAEDKPEDKPGEITD
jgi:serine/threonine protein kinase